MTEPRYEPGDRVRTIDYEDEAWVEATVESALRRLDGMPPTWRVVLPDGRRVIREPDELRPL